MSKDNDMKFIKDFTKITIKSICEDLKIDVYNLNKGKASESNTRRVKEEIERRYERLHEKKEIKNKS